MQLGLEGRVALNVRVSPQGETFTAETVLSAFGHELGRLGGLRDTRVLRSRMADVLRASRRRLHRDARGWIKGHAGKGYPEGHCTGQDH